LHNNLYGWRKIVVDYSTEIGLHVKQKERFKSIFGKINQFQKMSLCEKNGKY